MPFSEIAPSLSHGFGLMLVEGAGLRITMCQGFPFTSLLEIHSVQTPITRSCPGMAGLAAACTLAVVCALGTQASAQRHSSSHTDHQPLRNRLDAIVSIIAAGQEDTALRVAIGNFSYSDSGVPSAFSTYLAGELSAALRREPLLEEFARSRLDALLTEHKLSLSDMFDEETSLTLGRLQSAQGLIVGEYWLDDDQISASLRLLEVETGRVLGSGMLQMQRSELPSGLNVMPQNLTETKAALEALERSKDGGDFDLEVWVDRGDSATYRVGEDMTIRVKAETECYIKLYHVGADGQVKLLFPNPDSSPDETRLKADQVHAFPPAGAGFSFLVKKPLGTEIIQAVASSVPFKNTETGEGGALGGVDDLKSIRRRGLEVVLLGEPAQRAQSTCVFSIVE